MKIILNKAVYEFDYMLDNSIGEDCFKIYNLKTFNNKTFNNIFFNGYGKKQYYFGNGYYMYLNSSTNKYEILTRSTSPTHILNIFRKTAFFHI